MSPYTLDKISYFFSTNEPDRVDRRHAHTLVCKDQLEYLDTQHNWQHPLNNMYFNDNNYSNPCCVRKFCQAQLHSYYRNSLKVKFSPVHIRYIILSQRFKDKPVHICYTILSQEKVSKINQVFHKIVSGQNFWLYSMILTLSNYDYTDLISLLMIIIMKWHRCSSCIENNKDSLWPGKLNCSVKFTDVLTRCSIHPWGKREARCEIRMAPALACPCSLVQRLKRQRQWWLATTWLAQPPSFIDIMVTIQQPDNS